MRSTSTRWERIFVVSICVSNFKWIRRMIRRKSLLCALKSIFRVHLKAPKQVVGGLPCSRTFNLLTIHTTDSWLSARFWERFLICWQFYIPDLDCISACAVCILSAITFLHDIDMKGGRQSSVIKFNMFNGKGFSCFVRLKSFPWCFMIIKIALY